MEELFEAGLASVSSLSWRGYVHVNLQSVGSVSEESLCPTFHRKKLKISNSSEPHLALTQTLYLAPNFRIVPVI